MKVLGNLAASDDLNNLRVESDFGSVYICTGAHPSNWPSQDTGAGIVFTFNRAGSSIGIIQVILGIRGIAIRNCNIITTGWSDWEFVALA